MAIIDTPILGINIKYNSFGGTNETNKNKIIWGIVAAIVIILILIGISQNSNASAYSEAMNEYNNGNYETSVMLLDNYKDVAYMIDDEKYQVQTSFGNKITMTDKHIHYQKSESWEA